MGDTQLISSSTLPTIGAEEDNSTNDAKNSENDAKNSNNSIEDIDAKNSNTIKHASQRPLHGHSGDPVGSG